MLQNPFFMEEILTFLEGIAQNNNREWFLAHKDQYQKADKTFRLFAEQLILGIGKFDPSCQGLTVKDCTYRFYRDLRFSPDKRPYKSHFGAFICPNGKTSSLSGYYFHLQPQNDENLKRSLICTGMYAPDKNMLKSLRDEVLYNGQPFVDAIAKAPHFALDTEHNTVRVPNGYPKDHPYSDLFKQRDWLLVQNINGTMLYDKHLMEWALEEFKTTFEFSRLLNRTVNFEME